MKNKWKSSAFWISLTSISIVLINIIGKSLNFDIDLMSIISISSCVIGMLITVGVLSRDDTKDDKDITKSISDEIVDKVNKIDDKILSNQKSTDEKLDDDNNK